MNVQCPSKCNFSVRSGSIVRHGKYYRKSTREYIQRYKCTGCGMNFSQATNSNCFGQKKRQLNIKIYKALCSRVSQRRIALLLKISRRTVARKLEFLANECRVKNLKDRHAKKRNIAVFQFDDLETFEHTKMKPLSVIAAVEQDTRYILGFEVARMAAKGHLAKRARKKYGPRKDTRTEARERLFRRLQPHVHPRATLKSDENPHYRPQVMKYFPKALYITTKGRRGCVVGQGELKAGGFDPLFSLNHTFAMCRDNINRLTRKTWATTKNPQGLMHHLEIYIHYHNQVLIKSNLAV